jgi:hypothetical protein
MLVRGVVHGMPFRAYSVEPTRARFSLILRMILSGKYATPAFAAASFFEVMRQNTLKKNLIDFVCVRARSMFDRCGEVVTDISLFLWFRRLKFPANTLLSG